MVDLFQLLFYPAARWQRYNTMRYFLQLLGDEDGATAVEYAVMLALILMVIIGAIGSVGSTSGGMWGGIQNDLDAHGWRRRSDQPLTVANDLPPLPRERNPFHTRTHPVHGTQA